MTQDWGVDSDASTTNEAAPGRRPRRPDPIFQIGFNRCGTVSLHKFLIASGIPSRHWDEGILATRISARMNVGHDPIADYPLATAFTDMIHSKPGLMIEPYKRFHYLHGWYPNALFILNTRDRERWIASRSAHVFQGKRLIADFAEILSIPEAEVPDFWRHDWEVHHTLVRAYFRDSPNFLEFNIETDDQQKLISFIAARYPEAAGKTLQLHNQGKRDPPE